MSRDFALKDGRLAVSVCSSLQFGQPHISHTESGAVNIRMQGFAKLIPHSAGPAVLIYGDNYADTLIGTKARFLNIASHEQQILDLKNSTQQLKSNHLKNNCHGKE